MYACFIYCLSLLTNACLWIAEFCITPQSIAKSDMVDALESLYFLQSWEWQEWDHRSLFPREVSNSLILWLFPVNLFLSTYITSPAVEISFHTWYHRWHWKPFSCSPDDVCFLLALSLSTMEFPNISITMILCSWEVDKSVLTNKIPTPSLKHIFEVS